MNIIATPVATPSSTQVNQPTTQQYTGEVTNPVGMAVEVPKIEAPAAAQVEAPKAEVKPDETPVSRRLAEIARRERARVEAEQKWKSEKEVWETSKKEVDPILQAVKDLKANKNTDAALKFLEATGLNYEELTNYIISEKHEEPAAKEKTVQEQIDEALAKKEEANKQKDLDQFLADYKASIEQTAKGQVDKYKFINAEAAYDMVYDLCLNYYEKYNSELSQEIALDEVEKHLKALNTKELERLNALLKDAEPAKSTAAPTSETPKEQSATTVPKELTTKGYGNNLTRRSEEVNFKVNPELSKDEALQVLMKQLRSQ